MRYESFVPTKFLEIPPMPRKAVNAEEPIYYVEHVHKAVGAGKKPKVVSIPVYRGLLKRVAKQGASDIKRQEQGRWYSGKKVTP